MATYDTEYFRKKGKKGGKKTAERGVEYYQNIGRVGNAKRWEAYRKLKELNK